MGARRIGIFLGRTLKRWDELLDLSLSKS